MIQKPIDSIEFKDLEWLVSNQVAENKSLEYKAILKIDNDAEKKEFLYDISSFANAAGGDIIYGITEGAEKGLPGQLEGIEGSMDELCRAMENLIRDCIAPRILNIRMKILTSDTSKNFLFVRIPKSLNAPHQVTIRNVDRFYSRANNGKYVLDVFELRNAFLQNSHSTERIRNFIKDRLAKIVAGETPAPLPDIPKIVLHIVPLQSIEDGTNQLSIQQLNDGRLFPVATHGYNSRVNMEGVLNFKQSYGSDNYEAYVQLYRNGIIETVNAELLKVHNVQKLIYLVQDYNLEESVFLFVQASLELLKKRQTPTPVYLFLHLLNVKGYAISANRLREFAFGQRVIDKQDLQLPEIVLQDYPEKIDAILKDWFDSIWNACGFEKSLSFDHEGNFKALL